MKVDELRGKVPEELIESAQKRGIKELTPPQELSVETGLLKGSNFVIAAPTASGKTFIAEMPIIKSVIWDKKKALYVAPMRALVSEKFEEFKEAYPFLRVAMSIGDLDSLDRWLEKFDIIFVSTEKLDSLIRHGLDWLDTIGCIVFDEIHMLDEVGRGPTLEILITKLVKICKDAQIIALSATVGNSDEVTKWLNGKLVESDYRPVVLEKGIEFSGKVYYDGSEQALLSESKMPEIRITEDTLVKKKQLILFYSTKRNAEAGSEKIASMVESYLSKEEKEKLKELSEDVLHVLSRPTLQCEKLSHAILKGVAFHHSGLVNEQRRMVENAFKSNLLKAICSTTTLGLGVNLPAHTVVVRDTSRYSGLEGSEKIGVNEVTQLFGRAGRPKYDTSGRALLIARSKADVGYLYDRYIGAELEPITSKLGVVPVLRTHLLAFVATEFLTTEESILNFLKSTFYGYQYSDSIELKRVTSEILDELIEWKFIEKDGTAFKATKIGSRVSELYIDPLSAKWIIDTLPRVNDDIGNLFMICNTIEMRPYVRITESAEENYMQYTHLLSNSPNYESNDLIYYDPLKPFSTAMMLRDWASEKSEPEITKVYSTTPGALFSKVTNADWLLYSAMELSKLLHLNSTKLLETRVRVRYGVKKELIDLIRLEQVGRVRARTMYNNGIKGIADLRKPGSKELVERLFGSELSRKILEQIKNFE